MISCIYLSLFYFFHIRQSAEFPVQNRKFSQSLCFERQAPEWSPARFRKQCAKHIICASVHELNSALFPVQFLISAPYSRSAPRAKFPASFQRIIYAKEIFACLIQTLTPALPIYTCGLPGFRPCADISGLARDHHPQPIRL